MGDLINDRTVVPIDIVRQRLDQLIANHYTINDLSIYGGEISTLDKQYLRQLIELATEYHDRVGLATNGQDPAIFDIARQLGVLTLISVNRERPDYKRALKLIDKYRSIQPITIAMCVLPSVINQPVDQLVKWLDDLAVDVTLFEYYQTSGTEDRYKFNIKQYTDFMVNLLQYYHSTGPHKFKITNEYVYLDKAYNPDDSGFITINPYGKWSTVQYIDNNESYVSFDTLDQWERHCANQSLKRKIVCGTCDLFNQCKCEHFVVGGTEYCSGGAKIVRWYQQAQLDKKTRARV